MTEENMSDIVYINKDINKTRNALIDAGLLSPDDGKDNKITSLAENIVRSDNISSDLVVKIRLENGNIVQVIDKNYSTLLGKRVAYTPSGISDDGAGINGAKTYLAIIVQVFDAGEDNKPYCNLYVIPPFGIPHFEGSCQEGEGPRTFKFLE